MGKLLELELPIIWELIVQDEAACSPILVSGQVMPEASMLCVFFLDCKPEARPWLGDRAKRPGHSSNNTHTCISVFVGKKG